MSGVTSISRRSFLEGVFSAGAFVVCAPLTRLDAASAAATATSDTTWQPSVYLGIEPDGMVKIVAHRSEMGTGARTCLPMIVADELEADWGKVTIVQALGDKKYGSQNTDGSCSVQQFYDTLRLAGASARTALEQSAANHWNVLPGECRGQQHFVVHTPTGRKLGYGELVRRGNVAALPAKDAVRFKTPSEFRIIGKDVPLTDLHELVTGAGIFGIDARMPGMVYAAVARPPVMGSALKSVDDSDARKVHGVVDVRQMEMAKPPYVFQALGGAAVVATNSWAALQGRKALKIEWTPSDHQQYDSTKYRQTLLQTAGASGRVAREVGNVDAAFTAPGARTHEASYYTPMLAHASMEPPAAVAEFKDGKVVTWCATQDPQAVQQTVAQAVGIKPEDVECHVTLLGGGFGRKSKPDYVAEAAILSKQIGKPVKIVWNRQDDIQYDYFHSPAGMFIKAALDGRGRPTAWLQRSVFPPIGSLFVNGEQYGMDQLGMGWTDIPYTLANLRVENGPAEAHVRIGWLRSVSHIYHAFAVQTFSDELAAMAGRDRVEYLLDLIGPPRVIDLGSEGVKPPPQEDPRYRFDTARLRNVIDLVATRSGWAGKRPGAGRALGIAAHYSFLTYVASVVELEVGQKGEIRILKVDTAVDAGRVINPDRVKAQFEGAAVFGTSLTLMGEITAVDGRVQESNFDGYKLARHSQAPHATHVHIVPSDEPPAGVGEPGVPPMAPAICNAIFAATGRRVRELPVNTHMSGGPTRSAG